MLMFRVLETGHDKAFNWQYSMFQYSGIVETALIFYTDYMENCHQFAPQMMNAGSVVY